MTEIRDGEELSIDIPEGNGSCFVLPAGVTTAPPAAVSAACASMDLGALAPAPGTRLVAAGAVGLEGMALPARFAVRFTADASAVEPTPDIARDFGAREASLHAPQRVADGGAAEGGSVDIVAVGGSPSLGAPTSDVVTVGGIKCVRALFTLDLRESGHDVPVHFASYGVWAREGLYVLAVEGDVFHAAAVDAFADEAAKTFILKDPAPPAPSDVAQIGARMGQIGLGVLVLGAIVVGVLGARTRKVRG